MASTSRPERCGRRQGMRGEPSIEEWEQTLDADLLHHLIPAGQVRDAATA